MGDHMGSEGVRKGLKGGMKGGRRDGGHEVTGDRMSWVRGHKG